MEMNQSKERLEQAGEALLAKISEKSGAVTAIQERIRQKVLEAARSSELDRFVDYASPPPSMLPPG
ncbi:MAG: hypothetical protein CMJ95_13695 [Planctomycetes bacterium]|nr:hypothetical protein [Planctomycetota bacterium]